MSRYEQVLRHIRYRNWRPAALEARRFRIKCSELNGRYTSNEFNLEVSESCSGEGSPARPFIHFVYSGEMEPLVHLPLPVHSISPCSSQVSVLHEVRVSDKEHVNHLIVQPPFLQSVHHPESQTSIQRSSGKSPGRRDLRTPGADCDSRPSTQQTVRVQQPEAPRTEGGARPWRSYGPGSEALTASEGSRSSTQEVIRNV